MRSAIMRRTLVPLMVGFAIAGAASGAARAVEGLDFVIPETDGYGIADCMKPGMECGRVIADAWCEAHGHGHAKAFGASEDVTASTKTSATDATPLPTNSVIIHCGE